MDLDTIRNMNDEELRRFLNRRTQTRDYETCAKCWEKVSKKEGRVGIYVYKGYYKVNNRKLCYLCLDCYSDLLDYLGVNDIE